MHPPIAAFCPSLSLLPFLQSVPSSLSPNSLLDGYYCLKKKDWLDQGFSTVMDVSAFDLGSKNDREMLCFQEIRESDLYPLLRLEGVEHGNDCILTLSPPSLPPVLPDPLLPFAKGSLDPPALLFHLRALPSPERALLFPLVAVTKNVQRGRKGVFKEKNQKRSWKERWLFRARLRFAHFV